ncbi:MAG: Asp-tRNA(Asn)/Glu-tRNA(Gln) amidotransferase subunit GatB, partial [Sphingomonas sp.]|nr:Asp-tRNA(Asn)/Glu-tRNA(Gln) amidotransferase subunit GatB [Sphingomonas sp.]
RAILRYVGSCDGNMEEGSMRADVNVSVRKPGAELGTRTETKNVNSVRFVMAVIEHEAKRQVELIEEGGSVVQETRLYDPDRNVTRTLRSKEDAHDYRYFPDPDLLPIELEDAFVEECKASLPELPDAKRKRYESHGITPYNASVLTADVDIAGWFDALLETGAEPKAAANWTASELFGALNRMNLTIEQSPLAPAQAGDLLKLVGDGTLSGTLAKQVFEIMLETGEGAGAIVEKRGLKQTSDTGEIDSRVDEVIAANPDKVAEYKGGKQQLFGFFVGQVMKAMGGKANPKVVNDRLRAKLD